MRRAPRIQFEGAHYHIINRGNYRHPIFAHPKTAAAFEACLFEMCGQMGWLLHAHAVMRNHFHLVAETPRANLAQGMQWLESTFARRFNCYRNERGHLFQDRYKPLLVEPGPSLLRVVNYVHLNPVRAKAVPAERLADFLHGSVRWFRSKARPPFLICERWLHELGLSDTHDGWTRYLEYLQAKSAEPIPPREQAQMTRGWLIGSAQWGRAVVDEHREFMRLRPACGKEWSALREAQWTVALDQLLAASGHTSQEAAASRRGAPWKIELARQLRQDTSATIPWIARALHLGAPKSLSVYLSLLRKLNF